MTLRRQLAHFKEIETDMKSTATEAPDLYKTSRVMVMKLMTLQKAQEFTEQVMEIIIMMDKSWLMLIDFDFINKLKEASLKYKQRQSLY